MVYMMDYICTGLPWWNRDETVTKNGGRFNSVLDLTTLAESIFVSSVTNYQVSEQFNKKTSNEKENQAATTST